MVDDVYSGQKNCLQWTMSMMDDVKDGQAVFIIEIVFVVSITANTQTNTNNFVYMIPIFG